MDSTESLSTLDASRALVGVQKESTLKQASLKKPTVELVSE